MYLLGFLGGSGSKESAWNEGKLDLIPWSREDPLEREILEYPL